jgi:hypothetical protein
MHCMSWVVYLNFLCPGKCLCWLNSQLSVISLHSFEMLPDCVISGLYMRVLKLTFEKLFCKFFSSFRFLVWSVWTDLFLRPNESSLAICWPSNCTSGQDLYKFKTCFSFSAIHTSLHFYWFIMASCVFFSRGFLPRFRHLLHISSHPMIFVSSVILLSLCAFRILEYLLGYFSWDIVHENPFLSVCWADHDIFMPYE